LVHLTVHHIFSILTPLPEVKIGSSGLLKQYG